MLIFSRGDLEILFDLEVNPSPKSAKIGLGSNCRVRAGRRATKEHDQI